MHVRSRDSRFIAVSIKIVWSQKRQGGPEEKSGWAWGRHPALINVVAALVLVRKQFLGSLTSAATRQTGVAFHRELVRVHTLHAPKKARLA